MKKILLLHFLFYIIHCSAQQRELDSLLNALKQHPAEDSTRLNLLNAVAYQYNYIDPDKGLQVAENAIALASKINNQEKLAEALLNKGINSSSKGEYVAALSLYEQVLQSADKMHVKLLSAKALYNIGVTYFKQADYSKAIKTQEKALAIFSELHDDLNIANVFTSIASSYQFLSIYPASIEHQQRALELYRKTGYKNGIAKAYTNLGITYMHLLDFPKALDYHKQGYALYQQTGNMQGSADALGNMANVYDNMDDSVNAIRCYKQALSVSEQIKYKFGIASNTSNIGILYYYAGNYIAAMPYIKKATLLYEQLNNKNFQSLMLSVMVGIYSKAPDQTLLELGIEPASRYLMAIEYNKKALELSRETQSLRRQANVLNSLSTIYEKQGNYKEALRYYKESDILNDSILNDTTKKQITRIEVEYAFNAKQDSIKAVNDQKQALDTAEIQKQRIIKNSTMAGAGFLLITGVAGFIFYKRNRDIKTQKNEAELKAEITDTEMKALRTQMNPHFIFNSLNSIADYIDKSQMQTASDFTTKFARLMRMILENSEHKEIPLADDLKALELYMQLERFRLQNKFDYEIKVDERIDKENTLVPPLILQPFVENSIWHGIAKKEGVGNITIHIRQLDSMINCIVEDDGVGIAENKLNKQGYKSLGMRITNERVAIINKIKNTNASVDIFNSNNGVRAEVSLPLELSF